MRCSLPALLHEAADELLGVGLQHLVDLVEDRVDVLVELLLALGDVVVGRASAAVLGLVDLRVRPVLLATVRVPSCVLTSPS